MRILFISEFFPSNLKLDISGGIEARNYFVAKNLSSKHKCQVISSYEKGKPRKQTLNSIEIFRVGFFSSYTRTAKFQRIFFIIFAIIEGIFLDFDIVEGSGFWSFIPALILGTIRRKKKIILVPDIVKEYAQNTDLISYQLMRVLEKFLLRYDWDKIICISNTVKNKLIKLGVEEEKMVTIYCGIPFDIINHVREIKRKNTIVCISRLVPYKRVSDLIQAISILKNKFITVSLDIIGDGEEYTKLHDLTSELFLTKSIFFHRYLTNYFNVIKNLKQSYIYCLPSTVEGFGIATIEAMASGMPVVLSDIAVNHEITKNKGVLFFKPKNFIDLALKLELLLTDKNLYQKLRQEALLNAKKYDWNKTACKTEKLYESLYHN